MKKTKHLKKFLRLPKPVLAVALACTLIAGGCTAAQITAYLNLAAQIALNALTITSAFANSQVTAHDAQLVADFQVVLQHSVTSFTANRNAGNSVFVSILEASQSNIPQFLAAAQFDNPLLSDRVKVAATGFLQIVESIVVLAQPNLVVPPPVASVTLRSGQIYQLPARVKVSRQDIVNHWNAVVCAGASSACAVK